MLHKNSKSDEKRRRNADQDLPESELPPCLSAFEIPIDRLLYPGEAFRSVRDACELPPLIEQPPENEKKP